jgi:hypothetical protein
MFFYGYFFVDNMTLPLSYTIYDPNKPLAYDMDKPLDSQLESLGSTVIVRLGSYKCADIRFRTLKINDVLLEISLKVRTVIKFSKNMDVYLSPEYTYSIKNSDGRFDIRDVSCEIFEKTIKAIYTLVIPNEKIKITNQNLI